MKKRLSGLYIYTALSGLFLAVSGCGNTAPATGSMQTPHATRLSSPGKKTAAAAAPVCIYRMKRDYSMNVPVTMDATRTKIISYPAPTDLRLNGKLAYPTPLNEGFWLDNRGIGKNVAFLSYTYEEYSQLKEAPTIEQLTECIIDKNPLTEIHNCGTRNEYTDIVKELNELIEQKYKK